MNTLLEIVQNLHSYDIESTIYASLPCSKDSLALVLKESESGETPIEAKSADLKYFIEVFKSLFISNTQ